MSIPWLKLKMSSIGEQPFGGAPAALGGIAPRSLPRWLSRPEDRSRWFGLRRKDVYRIPICKKLGTVLKTDRCKRTLVITLINSLQGFRTAGLYPCFVLNCYLSGSGGNTPCSSSPTVVPPNNDLVHYRHRLGWSEDQHVYYFPPSSQNISWK